MARTEVASDTFTDGSAPRDLNTYNSAWINTYPSASVLETYAGGLVQSPYAADATYYYNSTFADDQYSSITYGASADFSTGVILRSSTGTNANRDHYVVYFNVSDGYVYISKVVNGSGRTSHLASSGTVSFGSGDTLSAEIIGNTISAYKNYTGTGDSTLVTYEDSSSPLASGYPGVFQYSNSTTRVITGWSGGDVTAGASAVVSKLALLGVG